MGHLTLEQEKILSEFKAHTRTLAEKEWKYELSQFDDYDYLRFLRARKFDHKAAIEMFSKYIKWRIEFGVDQIFVCGPLNNV